MACATVPVLGRTTGGAPATVPSVPVSAVTLKYREDDFQVRRASERGSPRDALIARLSQSKDTARTRSITRGHPLSLFPSLFFSHLAEAKSRPACEAGPHKRRAFTFFNV